MLSCYGKERGEEERERKTDRHKKHGVIKSLYSS
jgi:hypothetical protein